MAMKKHSDKTNTDDLAKMFKILSWEKLDDMNMDYYWDASGAKEARQEVLDNGGTEEEADEAESKAMEEVRDERFHKWHSCLISSVEDLFEKHKLNLIPLPRNKKDKYPHEYRIVPASTWEDAAREIITTINGVGMFEFSSLKEFLDSGPYTARQAVLSHWHWIKDYPEVYGDYSAQRRFEKCMD